MWRKPFGSGTGEGGNIYNGTHGKGGTYSVMPIASMTDKRTADKAYEELRYGKKSEIAKQVYLTDI